MNWCVAWLDDYLVVHLPKLDFHFNALLWKAHFQVGENNRQSNNLTYCLQRPGLSFTVIINYLSTQEGKRSTNVKANRRRNWLQTPQSQCAEESNENALCPPKTCDFMFFILLPSFVHSFLYLLFSRSSLLCIPSSTPPTPTSLPLLPTPPLVLISAHVLPPPLPPTTHKPRFIEGRGLLCHSTSSHFFTQHILYILCTYGVLWPRQVKLNKRH